MSLLVIKAGPIFRVGQLDFKLVATRGLVALAISHQSASAFGIVSICYALKLGNIMHFSGKMAKLGQRVYRINILQVCALAAQLQEVQSG